MHNKLDKMVIYYRVSIEKMPMGVVESGTFLAVLHSETLYLTAPCVLVG